jgi:hypothetical protein
VPNVLALARRKRRKSIADTVTVECRRLQTGLTFEMFLQRGGSWANIFFASSASEKLGIFNAASSSLRAWSLSPSR